MRIVSQEAVESSVKAGGLLLHAHNNAWPPVWTAVSLLLMLNATTVAAKLLRHQHPVFHPVSSLKCPAGDW